MASENIFDDYSEELITEHTNGDADCADKENQYDGETEDMTALINSEENETEQIEETNKPTQSSENAEREIKLFQLPLARIRNLMKLDPDLNIASNEALFTVTRATELFIESLSRESYTYTAQAKKKTVQKRDVDLAITAVDSLMFLDGAMNF